MDISTLSQQLNISVTELRRRMSEAGFRVSARARKIDNYLARQVMDKLRPAVKIDPSIPVKPKVVSLPSAISVRDLAGSLSVPVTAVIKLLIQNGVMASLNEHVDFDTAAVIAGELGFEPSEEKKTGGEIGSVAEIIAREKPEALVPRPPIVAVMGHVDHGKTKLLDAIRSTNVIDTEAGAITQHIGAYRALYKNKTITFLDTPGHEAFAAMRARGANVTDIIVLVVAADDGVKKQTLEVISRAKLTKTPMIVAINKIDKPEANPELVKKQLAESNVAPEEWGGKHIFVPISAKQKIGVDKLLDMILLTAEMENLSANPKGMVVGTVVESNLSKTQGAAATIIVQNGTLKVGDTIAAGAAYGRLRTLEDEKRNNLKFAGPSTPVRITGLSNVCEAGDLLRVYPDIKQAQEEARKVQQARAVKRMAFKMGIVTDELSQSLNLIIKADVQGSLEAILQELSKLENQEVPIKIISQGVGDINESDVLAGESSRATIIGFHNSVSPAAARLAKQKKVSIDIYEIIYELTEDITAAILKLILPEVERVVVAQAKILALFASAKDHVIVGGVVTSGILQEGRKALIIRGNEEMGEGKIAELQRNKLPTKQAEVGQEFGVKLSTKIAVAKGDIISVIDERLKQKKLKPTGA